MPHNFFCLLLIRQPALNIKVKINTVYKIRDRISKPNKVRLSRKKVTNIFVELREQFSLNITNICYSLASLWH